MALSLGGLAHRFGHRRVLLAGLAALPPVLMVYALAPTLELAVVAIFFVGAAYLCCLSSFMTIAQLRAPNELRGRVMSALMVLLGVLYPIGSIVQGGIADGIGLRATTALAAAILAIGLLAIRTLRPGFDAELRDPPTATPTSGAPQGDGTRGDQRDGHGHLPEPPEPEGVVAGGGARDGRGDEEHRRRE
jgi:MFS family permease